MDSDTSRLDELTWPVQTERLLIRRATTDDVDEVWQFRRLDPVARWLTSAPQSVDELRDLFTDEKRLHRTLVTLLGGRVIGDLMIAVEDAWSQTEVAEQAHLVQAEIGWCFHPEFGGKGYATEAVEALLRICFDDLKLRRVTANCFADNVPSWRLMERIGMRRELYTVSESLHRELGWLDGMGYAILADEWRTR